MSLPEFCEELFYTSNLNLFESNFKIYLQKVDEYSFLETQKWLKRLNKNYTLKQIKNLYQLNLYNCSVKKLPTLKLPNLQRLDLWDNKLTEFPTLNFLIYNNLFSLIIS